MSGVSSQGTRIAYSDGGSPSSFTNIGKVTTINDFGGGATPVNDVSDLDSVFKEKLMGLPDEGQVSLNLNLDPDNATHIALRTARRNRTRLEFKVTLTDATPSIGQFFAYVLTFKHSISVGTQLKADLTLEIDGEVTWS